MLLLLLPAVVHSTQGLGRFVGWHYMFTGLCMLEI
jgi:hypothetical protein